MAMKIVNVAGARPNFMKIAPIMEAFRAHSLRERQAGREGIDTLLVHTGQHYDQKLSTIFFDNLGIAAPEVNLGVGSGSHATRTAQVMIGFEAVCRDHNPGHVLVVGDINSTLGCALVACKLGIKVIHVEAGLRSFDRSMPEEINRILTDAISDHLFTTERSANVNLRREGIADSKVHFVGNVMIDSLLTHRKTAEASTILHDLGLQDGARAARPYAVLTLHRPAGVDDPVVLGGMVEALAEIARDLPIVFPVHPRTRGRLASFGFESRFRWAEQRRTPTPPMVDGIHAIKPVGYLDFLRLMSCSRLVLTDSGGIQEETTVLGVPCVTLRDSTERPVTLSQVTNVLAGTKRDSILASARSQLERTWPMVPACPDLWDGKAAERIVEILARAS